MEFRSLAIFEDQESINRKVLARFTDVCEKQFSSLGANRERICPRGHIVGHPMSSIRRGGVGGIRLYRTCCGQGVAA